MTRTIVHIDRLVLHDIADADRTGVARNLRNELQRLLGTSEFALRPSSNSQVSHLDAQTIHSSVNSTPAQLGSEAAQRVAKVVQSWTK